MLFFIYGTLKQGYCNHEVIEDLITYNSTIKKVTTLEQYPMYQSDAYFPYLEQQPGKGFKIYGELFEIHTNDTNYLEILDNFEGVPDLYIRDTIIVIDEAGNKIEAQSYFKKDTSTSKELEELDLLNEWIEETKEEKLKKFEDYYAKILGKK